MAHTLKARYYMHTAENSDLSYDNTKLNSVLTETASGILDPSGDFATQHTSTNLEENLFYQFLIGARAGDVEPSQLHIICCCSRSTTTTCSRHCIPRHFWDRVRAFRQAVTCRASALVRRRR